MISGIENDKNIAWFNNRRAIMFQVMRQPGTNTVEVVDRINALMPQFRAQLPPAVSLDMLYDRSESIRESVDDVKFTLVLAIVLVVLVIFLFLRNVSATIIPSLALPLSIVGTFAAMSLLGYTLDNLSLMALTLAVGFVVDDAIVVLENIVRHMEMGKPRMEAALEGGTEIAFTILSMTLSLAAVFIPVLFMGGIVGRLVPRIRGGHHGGDSDFRLRLAQPDADAVQPFPEAAGGTQHNALYRASERVFDALARRLRLDAARRDAPSFRHHAGGGRNAGCDRLSVRHGAQGLHPQPGHRHHSAGTTEFRRTLPSTRWWTSRTDSVARSSQNPNVAYFAIFMAAATASSNSGAFPSRLKPRAERNSTPEQVIEELRPKLTTIPGVAACSSRIRR